MASTLNCITNGDGTVVDQLHLHVGAELARLNLLAEKVGKPTDKLLVHGDGHLGLGGVDIAGSVAFLGAGHQRELADEQNAAVGHIGDGQIHHPVGIVEDAQGNNLAAKPVDVLVGVGILNAEEDHHPLSYL